MSSVSRACGDPWWGRRGVRHDDGPLLVTSRFTCVRVCVQKKIQTELNGHEGTLEEMKKKNPENERFLSQIDMTQVQIPAWTWAQIEIAHHLN